MLVLASGSPRRKMLLTQVGLRFEVQAAEITEAILPGESPRDLVERLAGEKARWVAGRLDGQARRVVLGSDTVVVLDDKILGKPRDPDHAVSMLSRLTGRTHSVLTGVALVESDSGRERVLSVESRVSMRPAEAEELRAYVASGEPLDKAGAYALQGEGRRFVTGVEGSETNVIGLPVDETLALLHELGVSPE